MTLTLPPILLKILAILVPLVHLGGFVAALNAVWRTRTSQGAVAWAISLLTMPYLSLPLYLVFGRSHFHGYVRARKSHDEQLRALADSLWARTTSLQIAPGSDEVPSFRVLESLARMPFTKGNTAELLIDGEQTFDAIFRAIEEARKTVVVQFYIARNDDLGTRLAELLARKAAQGVRCYYLYDEVGSKHTPERYWEGLRAAGIPAMPFNTKRGGWTNRFQINFRNHRKIVVVDGETAFVGGHNVGDDYLGLGPLGPWRDTHVVVRGPVVAAVQFTFLQDWHWATGELLELDWNLIPATRDGYGALALASGPVDEADTCALLFAQLLQSARKRAWIATPYFVPDGQVLCALKLAALRGVDVRILLPEKADHFLTDRAGFAFIEQVEKLGVRFFRYGKAFTHQKVALVDDDGVAVGTANLDNRSFRLNFEITLLFAGRPLAEATEAMLLRDFDSAREVPVGELETKPFHFRLAARIARLFSPIL